MHPLNRAALALPQNPSGPSEHLLQVVDYLRGSAMTVAVDEALLRRIHDAMDATVRAGEEVASLIREVAGLEPGPVSAHLLTMMQMGTGFHRAGRDTLRKLFTARNAVRRERKKKGAKS